MKYIDGDPGWLYCKGIDNPLSFNKIGVTKCDKLCNKKINCMWNVYGLSDCYIELTPEYKELINNKDNSWAVQHLQSDNYEDRVVAKYILSSININQI